MATRRVDRALLLGRFPFGESSLVAHAFTREHGRVHLLAKGAYRATSRFAWTLDLFDELELTWSERRGSPLALLAAGTVTRRRRCIPADLTRYRAALAGLELADLCTQERQPEPGLFDLTGAFLERLDAGAPAPRLELCAFDLRALDRLGLAPALLGCARCGRAAPPLSQERHQVVFSAAAGGRLCSDCATEARTTGLRVGTLPVDVLRVAHSLLTDPPENAARLRLTATQEDRLQRFVQEFLEHHLESARRSRLVPSHPA